MPMAQGWLFGSSGYDEVSDCAYLSETSGGNGRDFFRRWRVRIPLDTALQRNLHLAQQFGMQVLEIRPDGPLIRQNSSAWM